MTDFLQPDTALIERIREGLRPLREREAQPVARHPTCPRCDPTARAMDYARDQWVVAGIDRN